MRRIWNNPFFLVVAPAVLTLLGAIVGAYLTYHLGLTTQLTISDHQKRQQVFSELMGRKLLTMQLYVSRFEALSKSDYHEARWKIAGAPKDSLDSQEAMRWMRRSEDLVLDIAKNNQSLFETLGLIRVLFPKTTKLDELIDRLTHFKTPKILGDPLNMDMKQLEEWKVKVTQELQSLAESEYGKPVDDLLKYLGDEIRRLT